MSKLEKLGLTFMIWGAWINILAHFADFFYGRQLGAAMLGIGTCLLFAESVYGRRK